MLALEMYQATSPEWKGCFSKVFVVVLGLDFGNIRLLDLVYKHYIILSLHLLAPLRKHAHLRRRPTDSVSEMHLIFPYLPVTIIL